MLALEPALRAADEVSRPGSSEIAPPVFAILAAVCLLHFVLVWMDRRGWIRYRAAAFAAAIGNALVFLAEILQPHKPTVVQVQRTEGTDTGDPPDPRPPPPKGGGAWPDDGLRGPKPGRAEPL